MVESKRLGFWVCVKHRNGLEVPSSNLGAPIPESPAQAGFRLEPADVAGPQVTQTSAERGEMAVKSCAAVAATSSPTTAVVYSPADMPILRGPVEDRATLTQARSMLLLLLATCKQTQMVLQAAANALDTDLTGDLGTMIERSERELVSLNAKIEALPN